VEASTVTDSRGSFTLYLNSTYKGRCEMQISLRDVKGRVFPVSASANSLRHEIEVDDEMNPIGRLYN
jgi:hypothetical protein